MHQSFIVNVGCIHITQLTPSYLESASVPPITHHSVLHGPTCRGWAAVPLPTWLPWLPQLLSRLDGPEGDALMSLLSTLADRYPQRMYVPLNLSLPPVYLRGAGMGGGGDKEQRCGELAGRLRGCGVVREFIQALDKLTPPMKRWGLL